MTKKNAKPYPQQNQTKRMAEGNAEDSSGGLTRWHKMSGEGKIYLRNQLDIEGRRFVHLEEQRTGRHWDTDTVDRHSSCLRVHFRRNLLHIFHNWVHLYCGHKYKRLKWCRARNIQLQLLLCAVVVVDVTTERVRDTRIERLKWVSGWKLRGKRAPQRDEESVEQVGDSLLLKMLIIRIREG